MRKEELKCGFCDGMHEEKGCEVRERMRELWRKGKEKEEVVVLAKSGATEVGKELVRLVSIGACSGVGVGENNEEEGGFIAAKKKSQCQCWKHQFWKKLEMNISLVSNAEFFFVSLLFLM